MKLTDEAIHIANELAKIQPDTIVESVIRRLVGELHFKERYIETYRIGKSQTESGEGGTDYRAANAQPGASSLDARHVKSKNGAGEA
jgi:hypothetical protein